jgi:outer membrane lipoprotein carrier protein
MRYFTFILLIFFPILSFAETGVFACKPGSVMKPAEAKAMLEKTQKAYSTVETLKADFTQYSYLSALDTSETSSGKLSFTKPGKMKWEYDKPEEQIFLIIDTTLWFYQALDKQVVVDKFEKFLISDLPVAFILGIGDLNKSFNIEQACISSSDGGVYFSLLPKNKKISHGSSDDRLEKFELIVGSNDFLPKAAKIYDVASNINTFYLTEQKINAEIPDSVYLPQFPKGTDIDDRRRDN